MSFLRSKRGKLITIGGTVAGLAVTVAAVAYFTTNGSGTATGTVGSSSALSVVQTGTVTGLVPGGPSKPIVYTINNPSGNGFQTLGIVSATVTSVTPAAGHTCVLGGGPGQANLSTTAGTDPVGTIGDGLTFNSTSDANSEPTVSMANNGDQDGCQGATVNFSLTAAQGS